MPIYEFHCQACAAEFEQMTSISARDHQVACPKCGSKNTGRKLSVVAVGNSAGKDAPSGGHVHSGGCCCGNPMGSCGMN